MQAPLKSMLSMRRRVTVDATPLLKLEHQAKLIEDSIVTDYVPKEPPLL